MFTTNASAGPLEFEVYEKSQSNIKRLKESLPEDLVASLAREVIRRLASREINVKHIPHGPSLEELEDLCSALISADDKAAANLIGAARADGVAAEEIYLKYLASAAQMLGKWWDDDKVSFVEVTVGSGRMFAIMRSMKHLFSPTFNPDAKSAIFASVPGEDHTLGVRMAADLFRSEGWDIALKVGLGHDELVADIERTPNSVVGLSLGGRHSVDALSRLAVALNICCPSASLVVCGQEIEDIKPLLSLMGFDGIAGDIEEARDHMTALWHQKLAG